MAEEEVEEQEVEEGKKSKKKLFIFVGAGVLIVIIAALLFFFLFIKGGDEKIEEEPQEQEVVEEQKEEEAVPQKEYADSFYPGLVRVGELDIKLKPESEGIPPKTLKISFYVEFKTDENKYLLEEKLDIFQKQVIEFFGTKTSSEIDDISEKLMIKQLFVRMISDLLNTKDVQNIYFAEFLIFDW